MLRNPSDSPVYATYREVVAWWLVYVILDALVFGVLFQLYSTFFNNLPRVEVSTLSSLFVYTLSGIAGKTAIIAQFPAMIILLVLLRKKLLLLSRRWMLIPTLAFIVGYCYLLIIGLLQDTTVSLDEAFKLLAVEFNHWADTKDPLSTTRPMALISTFLASIPWVLFLKHRFKRIQSARLG